MLLLLFAQEGAEPPVEPTATGSGGGGKRRRGVVVREALDLTPKESDRERAERIAALLDAPPAKAPERAEKPAKRPLAVDATAYQAELGGAADVEVLKARVAWLQAQITAQLQVEQDMRRADVLAQIYAAAEAHAARLVEEDELILAVIAARG